MGRRQLGSRIAAVNLKATAAHPAADHASGSEQGDLLNRRVAVVKAADLTAQRFRALVESRHAGAILVLLPSDPAAAELLVSLPSNA